MAGWRGAAGSSIPLTRHGSGGYSGDQLSPSGGLVSTGNAAAGGQQQNVSNTATLPNRGAPVVPQFTPPSNIPGQMYGVPGRVAMRGGIAGSGVGISAGASSTETGFAYGNPDKHTQEGTASGGPGAIPGASGEPSIARRQPFGAGGYYPGNRPMGGPNGVFGAYGTEDYQGGRQIANDKLWATDRHGIMNTGTERGGGRCSGETDPPMDGPPRPALRLVQRTINWQQGNPLAAQDHEPGEQRNYSMANALPPGYSGPEDDRIPCTSNFNKRESGPQYVGEQGIGWSSVYGGVPGLWQPYGSYAGYTADSIKGIQSPAPEGSPQDGPQKVFGGIPHGLHSQTYPDYSSTLGRYMAIPQMSLPRQDRPSNSTSAGQSYNQTVVPQGQTGTVGVQASGTATPGAVQSQAWRGTQSKGWRGIRPGGGQT